MLYKVFLFSVKAQHEAAIGILLPRWLSGKESACIAGDRRDAGWIPGWGRFPGGDRGNPLQYSCLENLVDRGAWWATVHRVPESDTTEAT